MKQCTAEEKAAYYFLSEPLYKMACLYDIAEYILWAYFEDKVPGPNPYRPLFDLWRAGAGMSYVRDDLVHVYAPPVEGGA